MGRKGKRRGKPAVKTSKAGDQSSEAGDETGSNKNDTAAKKTKTELPTSSNAKQTGKNRNTNTGSKNTVPFCGGVDALEILPAEVWFHISKDIDDPNDFLTFTRTSSRFNEMLMSKKTELLFPEVIKHVMEKLPKEDFLNCRSVCKTWKKAVDTVYENHPLHLRFHESEFWSRVSEYEWLNEGHSFNNVTEIRKFLSDMKTHTGNPFPGRCVEFYDNGDPQAFWSNVKELLERFGSEIWHLYLIHEDEVNVEADIRDCLMLVPNLKKLRIDSAFEDDNDDLEGNGRNRINTYFTNNPLPKLPFLETLAANAVPEVFASWILKSCCEPDKLKRLDLQGCAFNDALNFTNLEELSIEVDSDNDLAKLLKGKWPLKIINLNSKFHWFKEQTYSFKKVVKSLQQFKKTLTQANLDIQVQVRKEDMNLHLNLPLLTKLEIDFSGPLDLFANLKSLQHLKVHRYHSRSRKANVIKVYGFEYRMYDSNVWDVFPSLQSFDFEGQSKKGYVFEEVYTRGIYEFNKRERE